MKLYNRLNSWLRRRKPRTERSAVETRIEEGRASGDIRPYGQYGIVQTIEDSATPHHHWHGYGNARPTMNHDASAKAAKHSVAEEDDASVPEGLVGEWKAPV